MDLMTALIYSRLFDRVMERLEFWLVTTAHLEDRLWFRDDDDFKVGMNLVAVLAASSQVLVLAFILMSNHVHFVLQGDYESCLQFITRFKKIYAQYFSTRYSSKELLRRNDVDLREIYVEDESLERAIAYVQMNSVAANICLNANEYLWGTGNCFFNPSPHSGVPLGNLSVRAKRSILRTHMRVPSGYLFLKEGYIAPISYVQYKFVESLFRTPRRMNYFLKNSSKARRLSESGENEIPTFKDQSIRASIPDLCRAFFHMTDAEELSDAQRGELLRQLKYRFSANVKQLARVSGMSSEKVSSLLDTF